MSAVRKLRGPQDLVIVPAGRYKALKKLAETPTAEIFLAEHVGVSGLRRLHVLKRLRANLANEASFRVALSETARESMALHHGNLVGVLDAGDASGRPFLVLELVEGWSLDQLMWRARTAQHALPWPLAVFIAAEVARGLSFLHRPSHGPLREGVVHGDISPASVLLSDHAEVKLGDWAVAHARARHLSDAGTATKAAFASPELALNESVDARSDLFALGSLLYWMLADLPPFKGTGEREVLGRVEAVDCVPLAKLRPGLPRELYRIVTACMQREPAHRIQTAGEVRAALEAVSSRERCGRSELETWLASLARRDGRGPASGEARPNVVVPLRTVKEAVKPPALVARPPLKVLAAIAAALVGIGFAAERVLHRAPPTADPTVTSPTPPPPLAPAPVKTPEPPPPPARPSPSVVIDVQDVKVDLKNAVATPSLELRAHVESLSDEDRAFVRFESSPPGATVSLDDHVLGTTPFTCRFKRGVTFALNVQHEGMEPLTRWMTVQNPEEVALTLPPQ